MRAATVVGRVHNDLLEHVMVLWMYSDSADGKSNKIEHLHDFFN